MHWFWLLALIVLAAMASSRSAFWNAVFCRLWMLVSGLWVVFVWYLTNAHGHVEWPAIFGPPLVLLLGFSALHWVFSGLHEWPARRWRR